MLSFFSGPDQTFLWKSKGLSKEIIQNLPTSDNNWLLLSIARYKTHGKLF